MDDETMNVYRRTIKVKIDGKVVNIQYNRVLLNNPNPKEYKCDNWEDFEDFHGRFKEYLPIEVSWPGKNDKRHACVYIKNEYKTVMSNKHKPLLIEIIQYIKERLE